jgi:hypothetical protein
VSTGQVDLDGSPHAELSAVACHNDSENVRTVVVHNLGALRQAPANAAPSRSHRAIMAARCSVPH